MPDRDLPGTVDPGALDPSTVDPGTLDVRLAHGRADLLESIDQPPLARIRGRAAARRRRRRSVGTGAVALLSVVVAVGLSLAPWADATDPQPAPVAEAPPGGPVYSAAGITINGLTEPGVQDVPGSIVDVEFTDPDHGYLLAGCPATSPCPATVARTADGGFTWQHAELPPASRGQANLDLIAFPGGRLTVTDGAGGYASTDHGQTWQPWQTSVAADPDLPTSASPGDLLRPGPAAGRCERDVAVWRPGSLRIGVTQTQPDLDVCWVAPAQTVDGAWWVGGTRNGAAAVAVTRDRGAHWRAAQLPGSAGLIDSAGVNGTVEVASLGSHAYAAVLGADRAVLAIYHSADGGQSFTRVRARGPGPPEGLAGTPVPLLDGRLLVAGTDQFWYLSTDDGATFTRAEGSLPLVGRLVRTLAGYVAYDLFDNAWAAYSSDGATWRKLQIH